MIEKIYDERQWAATPYAKSDAKNSDADVQRLLGKYGVDEFQWTSAKGPHARKAVILRFNLNGHTYRIAIEVLNAPKVAEEDRLRQVKRAMFWMLKAALEAASVFFSAEEALFAYLELPDGKTVHEASSLQLSQLNAANFGELVWETHKALPER